VKTLSWRTVLYAVLGAAVLVVLVHQYRARISHQMVDFAVYRTAAVRISNGEPLYRAEDGHYQFKYLPAFALAMVPFGDLGSEVAKAAWFTIEAVCLVWLMWASVAYLPDRRIATGSLAIISVVLMAKFYGHELTLGQANALLGALLVSALVALRYERAMLAAALVAAAVFVKPYAIIVLPWLALTRGVRPVVMATLVIGAGLAAPAAIYGWSGNLDLLRDWAHTVSESTTPNLLGADNVSVAAMWAKWIDIGPAATWLGVLTAVLLAGAIAYVTSRRRRLTAPDYLEVALLMLAVPLISPQGWDYVLLLATPAVVCLVDRWRESPLAWRIATALALATMCLTTFDVMGREAYGRFMGLSLVTVAALVLVAALVQVRMSRKA
jgi:hypothetical protein